MLKNVCVWVVIETVEINNASKAGNNAEEKTWEVIIA